MFISELGEDFSDHIKEKLMHLDARTFLTRKELENRLDVKHVEHLKYDCNTNKNANDSSKSKKEYTYGEFEVVEGTLYLTEKCLENKDFVQAPGVSNIYESLGEDDMIVDNGKHLKKLNDDNIDFVIDSILSVCPEVSQKYIDIVKGMVDRSNNR